MGAVQTGIQLNDYFSDALYRIIDSVSLAVTQMDVMAQAMNAGIDVSSLDGARDEINAATMAANELSAALEHINAPAPVDIPVPEPVQMPTPPVPEPVEIPIQWQSPNLDVFTNSGVERFQQEVQSANIMLEQLNNTQATIAAQAQSTTILPPQAVSDINGMTSRIDGIRDRIQQIESNPINMGTDAANSALEQLRAQLSQAVDQQQSLNDAMDNLDVNAANDAYLRLSQIIANTERYLRDNVDGQDEFNNRIRDGTEEAFSLGSAIGKAVGAYLSFQAVEGVLNISDELVQTTSRLNMMNDGLQSTEELVNMVYVAAQDARGSFSEMADVVARFGNNAGDAFSGSTEVVAFANLVQKQMTIAGASTAEASNAMLQLSQGLGSGVLRGDELNSIFEQAPNLIQNIADYLDVPIGQIREMASAGELSADVVKAAIFSASDEINAKFQEMPMTWGQIWQSMQNTALIAFQSVLQRLNNIANSEAFQAFANGAIQAMATLANIVLNIFDLIGMAGGLIADNWSIISPIIGGIVVALGLYTAALIANNIVQGINTIGKVIGAIQAYQHAKAVLANAAAYSSEAVAAATATVAQTSFNTALLACPLTWIILLVIALIAVIAAVCSAIAKSTGVASSGFGVFCGAINVGIQFFKNLGIMGANVALGIICAMNAVNQNIKTAFNNAICSVQSWWYNLLSTVLTVVAGICEALNKIPFIEFDYSGVSNAAQEYANKSAEAAGNKQEYTDVGAAFNNGFNTFDAFGDGWAKDAFDSGAAWGDGISDKISNFSMDDLFGANDILGADDYADNLGAGLGDAFNSSGAADNLDSIAGSTGSMADSLSVGEEELKYLRDLAEQDVVSKLTSVEVTIDQSGMTNTINNTNDMDGFVSGLTDAISETVNNLTEGVHK